MKKILFVIALMIGIILLNTKEDTVLIPNEAIRFRVIASSNSEGDQLIKKEVKQNLQEDITKVLKDTQDLEESRSRIQKNINLFSSNVKNTLETLNSNSSYDIKYGMNYFPEKIYKGVTYPEGEYESLVVTLGKGGGANFWCVLFPPLCLLEAEETKATEVEYKSFVSELLNRYF